MGVGCRSAPPLARGRWLAGGVRTEAALSEVTRFRLTGNSAARVAEQVGLRPPLANSARLALALYRVLLVLGGLAARGFVNWWPRQQNSESVRWPTVGSLEADSVSIRAPRLECLLIGVTVLSAACGDSQTGSGSFGERARKGSSQLAARRRHADRLGRQPRARSVRRNP